MWLLFDRFLRILNGLIVTSVVARHLGPANYGLFAVVLGTTMIFAAGASMGAEHINTAKLSKSNESESLYFLVSASICRIIFSIFISIIFYIYTYFAFNNNYNLYVISSFIIPLSALSIFGNKIQSDGFFNIYAKINIFSLFISIVLKITGIYQF